MEPQRHEVGRSRQGDDDQDEDHLADLPDGGLGVRQDRATSRPARWTVRDPIRCRCLRPWQSQHLRTRRPRRRTPFPQQARHRPNGLTHSDTSQDTTTAATMRKVVMIQPL